MRWETMKRSKGQYKIKLRVAPIKNVEYICRFFIKVVTLWLIIQNNKIDQLHWFASGKKSTHWHRLGDCEPLATPFVFILHLENDEEDSARDEQNEEDSYQGVVYRLVLDFQMRNEYDSSFCCTSGVWGEWALPSSQTWIAAIEWNQ